MALAGLGAVVREALLRMRLEAQALRTLRRRRAAQIMWALRICEQPPPPQRPTAPAHLIAQGSLAQKQVCIRARQQDQGLSNSRIHGAECFLRAQTMFCEGRGAGACAGGAGGLHK